MSNKIYINKIARPKMFQFGDFVIVVLTHKVLSKTVADSIIFVLLSRENKT